MPGCTGTITSLAKIASASDTECSGPAPPKPISEKLRGSMPLATELALIASAMLLLTILRMPSAALSTDSFKRPGDVLLDRLRRRASVDLQIAAEEMLGIQPAEHDLGVRHRRLVAALAVAGRAGLGAGRARADAEGAARIDIGDRAAAGADRVDVDHRHQHRQAARPRCRAGS